MPMFGEQNEYGLNTYIPSLKGYLEYTHHLGTNRPYFSNQPVDTYFGIPPTFYFPPNLNNNEITFNLPFLVSDMAWSSFALLDRNEAPDALLEEYWIDYQNTFINDFALIGNDTLRLYNEYGFETFIPTTYGHISPEQFEGTDSGRRIHGYLTQYYNAISALHGLWSYEGKRTFTDYILSSPEHALKVENVLKFLYPPLLDEEGTLQIVSFGPNPTQAETQIYYQLEYETNVSIEIYSIEGKRILEEDLGIQQIGGHIYKAPLSNLTRGTYIIYLQSRSNVVPIKIIKLGFSGFLSFFFGLSFLLTFLFSKKNLTSEEEDQKKICFYIKSSLTS